MWLLIAIIVGIVLLIWGLASYEGSHAAALQAQAAIEASRATQIAASGQAVVSILLAVIVLLVVVIAAMGVLVWIRSRQLPIQHRLAAAQQLQAGQTSNESLQQFQQLLTLQLLARLAQPQQPEPLHQLPSADPIEDETLPWWE
jgi:hypothetical protein